MLDGQPLYDMGFEAIKGWGLFYYPPLFLPFILPLGLLDPTFATWLWIAVILAAFFIGVAILPVSRTIKWLVVLLAGLSWPFVYAVKLGQVGPLLFLTFAVGWRWMDNPARLGLSAAVGTAIKMQPALDPRLGRADPAMEGGGHRLRRSRRPLGGCHAHHGACVMGRLPDADAPGR